MELKIFVLPLKNYAEAEIEMNRFLRSQKVLTVKKKFVADGENSFWTFCVEHLSRTTTSEPPPGRAGKVDYREVLSAAQFSRFSALRAYRKAAAEREGLPIYAVFTNEQLAQMVRTPITSLADLRRIEGVG